MEDIEWRFTDLSNELVDIQTKLQEKGNYFEAGQVASIIEQLNSLKQQLRDIKKI